MTSFAPAADALVVVVVAAAVATPRVVAAVAVSALYPSSWWELSFFFAACLATQAVAGEVVAVVAMVLHTSSPHPSLQQTLATSAVVVVGVGSRGL